ncbi:hypothetical protein JCM10908_000785 [Rhodotorula pacifica]|uniref:uncharacterized protein n=1 Tax=Rhodotorula pacifica TaxID=1495444 RepID=UPI00317CEDF6
MVAASLDDAPPAQAATAAASHAEMGQSVTSAYKGPHPHEHHLVPSHWSHASSVSPFSDAAAYGGGRRAPLIPPTRAEYIDPSSSTTPRGPGSGTGARKRKYRWTARAHRKGVPPRLLDSETGREEHNRGFVHLLRREEKWWNAARKVRWWGWDVRDISWWVGFLFTLGSVWWCIQGIQVFCYPDNTSTAFTNTEAAMAFLGGTTFLFGGYLEYVEALNPAFADWEGAFAQEVERELTGQPDLLAHNNNEKKSTNLPPAQPQTPPRPRHHPPTLGKRRRHFGSHAPPPPPPTDHVLPSPSSSSTSDEATLSPSPPSHSQSPSTPPPSTRPQQPRWKWFGLPPPHKRLDLGFLANAIQLFGAIAFEVSVICGLPGVLGVSGSEGGKEQMGRVEAEWVGAYWAMQIVGSPCFIIAGLIFALETQTRWYKPNLVSIGWWIGIWNMIGGFGFWFSGIFGVWRQTDISDPQHFQHYGTAFSTFWGAWAFLIGSYIQMLETLNKWT